MADSLNAISTADGGNFPSIGLGTWKIPDDLLPGLIQDSIKVGYRHFDCACDYGNEPAVGEGLRAAFDSGLCTHDDVWVTSKLWNTYHEPQHVRAACERSLRDLQLDELDLYLIHFPVSLAYIDPATAYPPGWFFDGEAENPAMKPIDVPYAETWGAMEELQRSGLVKRIGVCNLTISLLRDLLASCSIRPQVQQIELHPYLTQQRMLRFCRDENITVTAFSPFGASSYVPLSMAEESESLFDDEVMRGIAESHGRSIAQVALRWAVQRGTVAIPKTQTAAHLEDNFRIYDFLLSDAEMQQIDALNRNRRFNDPGDFCEAAFNTFYPIFD